MLVTHFPEITDTEPELVAHHFTEAGSTEPAIDLWLQAGKNAGQRFANKEAIAHLTKGIDLLQSLPETPDRNSKELSLQTTLGPILMTIKGYGAPEVAPRGPPTLFPQRLLLVR